MKASIISISWLLAGRPRPLWQASSASAGPFWASGGREGEHHQHQLAACWASAAFMASIISISWPLLGGGREGASSASVGCLLGVRGLYGKHHQHQLAPSGRQGAVKASIISISWLLAGRPRPLWQASSASAGPFWASGGREGEHHQHQLAACWASAAFMASIISISWPLLGVRGP